MLYIQETVKWREKDQLKKWREKGKWNISREEGRFAQKGCVSKSAKHYVCCKPPSSHADREGERESYIYREVCDVSVSVWRERGGGEVLGCWERVDVEDSRLVTFSFGSQAKKRLLLSLIKAEKI